MASASDSLTLPSTRFCATRGSTGARPRQRRETDHVLTTPMRRLWRSLTIESVVVCDSTETLIDAGDVAVLLEFHMQTVDQQRPHVVGGSSISPGRPQTALRLGHLNDDTAAVGVGPCRSGCRYFELAGSIPPEGVGNNARHAGRPGRAAARARFAANEGNSRRARTGRSGGSA